MKKLYLGTALLLVFLISSCKKKEDLSIGFSDEIQKIVPQAILDDVKAKGMTIHEGKVPPSVEGIFTITPYELLSPYSTDDGWQKGKIIGAYTYKFSGQSNDKKTLLIDYKNADTDRGSGLGAFVAGNGNSFTIFAEIKGTGSGVDYVTLMIISGEISDNSIKDFQLSLYMKEKNEAPGPGKLIPVNTGRIWFDNDFFSQKTTTFRKGVETDNDVSQGSGSAVSAEF